MPEVVYPSPAKNGKTRNWDDVFEVWKLDESQEWPVVDSILEVIAMNNRMGHIGTQDDVKAHILENVEKWVAKELQALLDEAKAFDGGETKAVGGAIVKTIPEGWSKKRSDVFAEYGRTIYYVNQVFANLGGAYREYKK